MDLTRVMPAVLKQPGDPLARLVVVGIEPPPLGQARCRYSLDVGAFKTKDPLAEFLFDKKKGYCEYFASATVMLLRLQGVPARYVNGLSVRDADRRARV